MNSLLGIQLWSFRIGTGERGVGGLSLHTSHVAHQARVYPGFCSMTHFYSHPVKDNIFFFTDSYLYIFSG